MKNPIRSSLLIAAALVAGFAQSNGGFAQRAVEELKAAHPEITGLELSAKKPGKGCQTISATEVKEVGEKCDQDEWTAWNTNRPFIEQEKDEFDATLPVHDAHGKVIATAGMDFTKKPGLTKTAVEAQARKIVAELERRFPSESDLFRTQ